MAKKKILSAELSEEILDHFTDHTIERGYVKYRGIEGAMKAFMAFPPKIQAELMRESLPQEKVANLLVIELLNEQTINFLAQLSPQDRLSVLNQAKKASKKASRKKEVPQ